MDLLEFFDYIKLVQMRLLPIKKIQKYKDNFEKYRKGASKEKFLEELSLKKGQEPGQNEITNIIFNKLSEEIGAYMDKLGIDSTTKNELMKMITPSSGKKRRSRFSGESKNNIHDFIDAHTDAILIFAKDPKVNALYEKHVFDSLRYKFNNLQEIDEVIKFMRRGFDIDFQSIPEYFKDPGKVEECITYLEKIKYMNILKI